MGIFNNPSKTVNDEAGESDYSKMNAAESKKAKAQARKKKKMAEKKRYTNIQQVFESEKMALFDGKSLDTFISSVAKETKDCRKKLTLKVAVAKAMTDADTGAAKQACEIVTGSGLNIHSITVDSCVENIEYLKSLGDSDEFVSNPVRP